MTTVPGCVFVGYLQVVCREETEPRMAVDHKNGGLNFLGRIKAVNCVSAKRKYDGLAVVPGPTIPR